MPVVLGTGGLFPWPCMRKGLSHTEPCAKHHRRARISSGGGKSAASFSTTLWTIVSFCCNGTGHRQMSSYCVRFRLSLVGPRGERICATTQERKGFIRAACPGNLMRTTDVFRLLTCELPARCRTAKNVEQLRIHSAGGYIET